MNASILLHHANEEREREKSRLVCVLDVGIYICCKYSVAQNCRQNLQPIIRGAVDTLSLAPGVVFHGNGGNCFRDERIRTRGRQ